MVLCVTHSPPPQPDSDPEKGFVCGAEGKSGACVPAGGSGPWWLARLGLGHRKFCSGALCSPPCRRGRLWRKAEGQEGWKDGTRQFRES